MNFALAAEGEHTQALAGDWLVRAAGPGEWRNFAEPRLDESGWQATSTPGRWWLDDDLVGENAVLYRRRFELPAEGELSAEGPAEGRPAEGRPAEGRPVEGGPVEGVSPDSATHRDARWGDTRWWLVASGLCDLGHLWLDGTYLGDLRGRHAEHAFEVTHLLRCGSTHLTAVEAAHGTVRATQRGDALMQIEQTGPARIGRVRALVIEANRDRAVLRISATVDSAGTHQGEVTTTLVPFDEADTGETDARRSQNPLRDPAVDPERPCNGKSVNGRSFVEGVLARGRNELEWLVTVDQPSLWWPAGMGDQSRYRVGIDVSINGQSSHAVRFLTGLRTVALRNGELHVNDTPCGDGRNGAATVQRDLAERSTYEDADATGTLLCQQVVLDPSIYAGTERGLRALANRAAATAVDRVGHHPSVMSWRLAPLRNPPKPTLLSGPWVRRVLRRAMTAADPTRPHA